MLEIFALPYFAVSCVIGWAVYAPFFRVSDSDSLSCAKLAISDLLALSPLVGVVFLSAQWMMPERILAVSAQAIVLVVALMFAVIALTLGLFLVPKTFQVTFLKRMIIVGVIAPFGLLLTVGWIGILVWVCVYSILYLIPSMIAIAATTFGLRVLGLWVCRNQSTKRSGNMPNQ